MAKTGQNEGTKGVVKTGQNEGTKRENKTDLTKKRLYERIIVSTLFAAFLGHKMWLINVFGLSPKKEAEKTGTRQKP